MSIPAMLAALAASTQAASQICQAEGQPDKAAMLARQAAIQRKMAEDQAEVDETLAAMAGVCTDKRRDREDD